MPMACQKVQYRYHWCMVKKIAIYLDHAAATPVAPAVIKAIASYWKTTHGNPSSLHSFGRDAKDVLERSRAAIAAHLGCGPREIVFTSGGTESINLALKGYLSAGKTQHQHVISTTLEHAAASETLRSLKKGGHTVTLVPCAANGIIEGDKVIRAITPQTTLISIIFAQNEIGTLQPVREVGTALTNINRIRKAKGLPAIALHTDAAQTPAFIELKIPQLHVDLLSLDASKMYGPPAVALLSFPTGI